MRNRRRVLAVAVAAVLLAAILAVFGDVLKSSQDRSHDGITTQVHDKAVVAANLISSLFQTVEQPTSQARYTAQLGGSLTTADLDAYAASQSDPFAVVTDGRGNLLAASSSFDPAAELAVVHGLAERIIQGGAPYYLSDFGPGGTVFAVAFKASDGQTRVLVTGVDPAALREFFDSELAGIPGVPGGVNYLLDGSGRVIAASDVSVPIGDPPPHLQHARLAADSESYGGYYISLAPIPDSGWRVALVSPSATLFASVSGSREYLPWILLCALAVTLALALLLALRVMRSADVVNSINGKLASLNSELTAANLALERRAAELARSNEELDSFASIASHDLQEPLRKVRTFTEQVVTLEGDRLTERGRDYLARAGGAAERMQQLIEDLLKFSRVSTRGRPFEAVDLGEVARRAVEDLEHQIEEAGARVEIGPLPVIEADPLQMQQLIQNLLSNAIKFRRPEVAPEVRVSAQIEGPNVRISVEDNGIGLEARYFARIFRIFERLHGRFEYPGTGIGLALCRKIADRHGGTIDVESTPGLGSTFQVVLPRSQPAAGSAGVDQMGASGEVQHRVGV